MATVDPNALGAGRSPGGPDRAPVGPELATPVISLPTGGGAIRGMGEKFAADPVTGTGGLTVPVTTSPGRGGFGPTLALSYDSGAGNGPFGLGWRLPSPSIARSTDKGLPIYHAAGSDTFVLSGGDDLVPALTAAGLPVVDGVSTPGHTITRYRPRLESDFTRIERWSRDSDGDVHWRTITADNVLSVYGADANSRIADPADQRRVFSWLLCASRDDRGNAIVYEYLPEDGTGVDVTRPHERCRGDAASPARTANRYLKRIRYGNRVPLLDDAGRRPVDVDPAALAGAGWMFEVVLDYGEHDPEDPRPDDAGAWACRADPFSSYRAGFEVRSYRLCRRVLMFHHFPEEPGIGPDCLVRTTAMQYDEQGFASLLISVVHSGHIRAAAGGYSSKAMPPLGFEYSQAVIDPAVHRLAPGSLENLPIGIDDRAYQWVDLDGDGLAGVLSEQAGAWWYRSNLGGGRLGTVRPVAPLPSLAALGGGRQQLLDVGGKGRLDLVQLGTEPAGFFGRTEDGGWAPFVPFPLLPTVDWTSQHLLLLDLTGDGRADLLLADDNVFTWHPSLAAAGFGAGWRAHQAVDDERGPCLVLADDRQSVFLADMSGDGLTDLVRIRNGEVCYWPNLGYGRFGAKVTMDRAPRFDHPDQFGPGRLRLADVDGTGVIDIIYLGRDGVRLWRNESGNAWAAPQDLPRLPHLASVAAVQVADLLGNGTACLVWSSPLPDDAADPVRYVDLMGGTKPHLLVGMVNNMGARTSIRYAASTTFFLADRAAGRPWATRLPFPVHVVDEVHRVDLVSRSRIVTRYAYHHGCYDGVEREFNGFGMVERTDAEAFEDYVVGVTELGGNQELAPELFQPPVTTRTWFHTGTGHGGPLLHQRSDEYYLGQQHLPEPVPPAATTGGAFDGADLREWVRACKGLPLRQEVYCFDGSPEAVHPYTVTEHTYEIMMVQRRGGQPHAVFTAVEREAVTLSYERNPVDPRIGHRINLQIGPHGEVITSAAVVYGRQAVDPALPAEVTDGQRRTYVTYGEQDHTPDIDLAAPVPAYRLRTTYESRGYEITGLASAATLFTRAELTDQIAAAADIAYETVAAGPGTQRRPIAHSRALFRDDAMALLALGQWDSRGLGYESYQLAYTPGVVAGQYGGQVSDDELSAAGYVHLGGDTGWWLPSGTALYPPDPGAHFYLATGARDALGMETVAVHDRYDLLTERVQANQASWSLSSGVNDYRVLGPIEHTDPNGRRTAVRLDELGMVVMAAVMGRAGFGDGDTLDDPTVRTEYELFNWLDNAQPVFAHVFARERHGPDNPRWHESYVYSTGSGGEAMTKAMVHPGNALQVNPDGSTSEVTADPRWAGTGRTIVNNKGTPVKRYEPYFSTTHEYEDEKALRELGATPVFFHDPLGRAVRTLFPNGTFSRVEFDAWCHGVFDVNDTVTDSRWYVERGSPDPSTEPEPVGDEQRRSAWLAAKHANTPAVSHLDSLGRVIYAVADHGGGTTAAVRSQSDLTGRFSTLFDQLGREVSSGFTAMAGAPVWSASAEKGRRWVLQDALGAVLRIWDEHGRVFRTDYDELHRPVSLFAEQPGQPAACLQHVVYGDRRPDAIALGLLGATHLMFDQGGMVRVPEVDFKGNPTRAERLLARSYDAVVDWTAVAGQADFTGIATIADPLLETSEVLTTGAEYDALGRPTRTTLPDATVLLPTYHAGGFLARLRAQPNGQGAFVDVLVEQDYDARGQRRFASYGNGFVTSYFYDPATFRLDRLLTQPAGADPAAPGLQDLSFTYDPAGNITHVSEPQLTHYFNNAAVTPRSSFEYDAMYQLVRATGRELAGPTNDTIRDHTDLAVAQHFPHPNDTQAVRNYTEEYGYDRLGNITVLRHRFKNQAGIGQGWTRHYRYAVDEDPADRTNRLHSTSRPGAPDGGPYTAPCTHDVHGNMTAMPHLAVLEWNAMDQLRRVDLGGGGVAHHVYAAGGRLRKVVDRQGSLQLDWIFLGPVTIFRRRRRDTGELQLERRTVRIADNVGPIAQVDTKTVDPGNLDPANPLGAPLLRYQFTNLLGSALLEADPAGNVISYEEYHPYGTSAYRYGRPGHDLSLKRYRFAGQELDEETGLYYAGARYYASWLGRWISSDPAGFADGLNLFRYCRNNPVNLADPSGMGSTPTSEFFDYRITNSQYTGRENFTVADLERETGEDFDSRITDKTARITYEPTYNVESRGYSGAGGTWVLKATFAVNAQPKAKPPPPPPPEPPPPPPPEPAPPPLEPMPPAEPPPAAPGVAGAAAAHSAPAAERFIWNQPFKGKPGTFRGLILEWLYGMPWRDNTPKYDMETATEVRQIKSTGVFDKAGNIARKATRDSAAAIAANPTGTMTGKAPRAVMITPTDTPVAAVAEIRDAIQPINNRKIPAGALPPELVRGLPGRVGMVGRGFTVAGFGISAWALLDDYNRGDAAMGVGDSLGLTGGGLEIYAIAGGGTILGVSAMTAGLAIGGIGIAVTSGVSGARAYQAGDTAGAIAGGVGVGAGLAITAGAIGIAAGVAFAPAILLVGIVAAVGVGIFHLGRHFDWW